MANQLEAESLLREIPTSFATVSIGDSSTDLSTKLEAIANAGFQGIELGFPDLVAYASHVFHGEVQADDYERLVKTGVEVKKMCAQLKLQVMMLQPFSNYEGWPQRSKEREDAMKRADGWIEIMKAVGTDMLQVSQNGRGRGPVW